MPPERVRPSSIDGGASWATGGASAGAASIGARSSGVIWPCGVDCCGGVPYGTSMLEVPRAAGSPWAGVLPAVSRRIYAANPPPALGDDPGAAPASGGQVLRAGVPVAGSTGASAVRGGWLPGAPTDAPRGLLETPTGALALPPAPFGSSPAAFASAASVMSMPAWPPTPSAATSRMVVPRAFNWANPPIAAPVSDPMTAAWSTPSMRSLPCASLASICSATLCPSSSRMPS